MCVLIFNKCWLGRKKIQSHTTLCANCGNCAEIVRKMYCNHSGASSVMYLLIQNYFLVIQQKGIEVKG